MTRAWKTIGQARRIAAGVCAGWICGGWPAGAAAGNGAPAKPDTATEARLIASPEPGWPQWRGPRRDGICDETGLLQRWPAGGPKLLWRASGLGRGYSAPIITHGRIFITGDHEQELRLFALDLDGNQVWRGQNGRSWKGSYPGARACFAYRAGRLFQMNAHGRVACVEAKTGRELWAVQVLERFGGKNITWALSECLLVDGPRVIVTPGGTRALMAALEVKSGDTIWTTEPLTLGPSDRPEHERLAGPAGDVDGAGYTSPILFTLGGRRRLVSCSSRHAFGVDADTGELLWTRPLPTRYQVIAATPVLDRNGVFITAPDAGGGKLFRHRGDGPDERIATAWTTLLDTCHGGLVLRDGTFYGSWYRQRKGWAAVDANTGTVRYELDTLAKGSVLYADQRLYCLSEDGEMALLEPTPQGFHIAGRFRLVADRKRDVWAHPVIVDGRLYLREQETLSCYDIRAR